MAELGPPKLTWSDDRPDPGTRTVALPAPLPDIGDDFDWQQRDFDSFQGAMWRELQDRFPERKRWTSGDVEAVIVEVLASVLDQLSDYADRASAESYLVTARRSESVLAWLDFIGYRPEEERQLDLEALLALYKDKPHELELDRRRGPASIRRQRRMVSRSDYATRVEEHPLVVRAYTHQRWNGSWFELLVTVSLRNDWRLEFPLSAEGIASPTGEEPCAPVSQRVQLEVERFHETNALAAPIWESHPTTRLLLTSYLEASRMVGHVAMLDDVVPVGVVIELCVAVEASYFQSEIRREVARALGTGPSGFFQPGRLRAGQDIQLGDIYGAVMPLDGVENVEVLRFTRQDDEPLSSTVTQRVVMERDEIAVCARRGLGELIVRLAGGRRG